MKLLTKEERDKELTRKEQIIKQAREAKSGRAMLDTLRVLADEEWLSGHVALEGNIYSAGAFGCLRRPTVHELKLFFKEPWMAVRHLHFYGAILIWLIQVLAPTIFVIQLSSKSGEWSTSLAQWGRRPATQCMGLVFLMIFNLNAVFTLTKESNTYEKISCLYKFLDCHKKAHTSRAMLWIGPWTKCYVFVMLCVCTTLVLGTSETSHEAVFDALSLFFIYNLDKVGGELTFVSRENWPGNHLAWLHDHMVKQELVRPRVYGSCKQVYAWTSYVVLFLNFALPVFYTVTDFGAFSNT